LGWFVFILALSNSHPARSGDVSASTFGGTPTGFGLISATKIGSNGQPLIYGGSIPTADWYIGQWQAPGDFPAFESIGSDEWSTTTAWATADVSIITTGSWVERISQNGAHFPCLTAAGDPLEFDLLTGPNAWSSGSYPLNEPTQSPGLAKMKSFKASVRYVLTDHHASPHPVACDVNHGYTSIGILLVNTSVSPRQLFWYSIGISQVCYPAPTDAGHPLGHPGSDYYFCLLGQKSRSPYWFWTGGESPSPHTTIDGAGQTSNFGMSDAMSFYGYSNIADFDEHTLSFDLRRRLTTLIESGPYGIDTDISHWFVSTVNYGQSLWGGVYLASRWDGFSVTWTTQ